MHMMSAATQIFPAGFLNAVLKQALTDKIKIEVRDDRKRPVKWDPKALIDWLRDYQHEAMAEAKKHSNGIFQMGTGGGKTEIFCALTEALPCRWLFLTHSKDLLAQTRERLEKRTGEVAGWIGDGKFAVQRVTIATYQSIFRGLASKKKSIRDFVLSVQAVMIDEAHRVPGHTFFRTVMALRNAYYRYGLSATPFARGDRKSIYLWGAVGPIIHRIPAERLIQEGVLAKPVIRMVTCKQQVDVKNWAEAYRTGITESKARNKLVISCAQAAEKPCLLFVKELAHGRMLEKELRRRGMPVEFVWGAKRTEVRRAAVRRLVHGDTDVLICNVIFQEGIDIPELQSVVIASGGKSIIMALQDVGRGMRRHSHDGKVTKTTFSVFDIRDTGCGCKGPWKHRGCKWLEKHTRTRTAAYASEAYEVLQVVIP